MFEFQLSLEYDLLGFLLDSRLSSRSACYFLPILQRTFDSTVSRPTLIFSWFNLNQNFTLTLLFPCLGVQKYNLFFFPPNFFATFFRTFSLGEADPRNGTAKLVRLFSLSNKSGEISFTIYKKIDFQWNNLCICCFDEVFQP